MLRTLSAVRQVMLYPLGQPTAAEPLLRAGRRARRGEQANTVVPSLQEPSLAVVADARMHWDPPNIHQLCPLQSAHQV